MTDHFVEVPKKVLSPAAQKVRDAVREICPAPADEIAAAAIHALADQAGSAKHWHVDQLGAIAGELESRP